MTLDTRIYVHGPVDHREAFVVFNRLLGAHEGIRFSDEQDKSYRDGEWAVFPDSPWTIANDPDQGLPGWLMIHYRPEAPLRTAAAVAACDEDCEPDCDGTYHSRACHLEVSIDTAYSYHGPDGGCGDLHARLVAEFGHWLDGKGVRWQWKNEFTGEVHWGYEGLTELGAGGLAALEWFATAALPAIAAHISED
jgi:hypothetical protein